MGLFYGDKLLVKKHVDRAKTLVESGGDWDRRNRLKAYQGLHLLTVRSYGAAAPLLLDSLSTFTSYELCSYSSLVVYSVLAGSVSLKRVDFKSKVVDAPEIKAILGDGEDKLLALSVHYLLALEQTKKCKTSHQLHLEMPKLLSILRPSEVTNQRLRLQ